MMKDWLIYILSIKSTEMNSAMQKPPKETEIEEAARLLKNFDFVHSALLFGSKARGITGRDIDICIIPSREISLKERLSLDSAMPSIIDISIFPELPVHIRKRIFEEGRVLLTKDM